MTTHDKRKKRPTVNVDKMTTKDLAAVAREALRSGNNIALAVNAVHELEERAEILNAAEQGLVVIRTK